MLWAEGKRVRPKSFSLNIDRSKVMTQPGLLKWGRQPLALPTASCWEQVEGSRERAETMGERFSKSELEVQAQRPWSGADTCNCGNRLPGIMRIARQTPRLGLRATGDGGQRWRALLGAQCL